MNCDAYAIGSASWWTARSTARRATSSTRTWRRARECRALAEDLLVVRRAARSLPPLDAARARLAARLRRASSADRGRRPDRRRTGASACAVPLAIAAVLLAAVAITCRVRRAHAVGAVAETPSACRRQRPVPGRRERRLRRAEVAAGRAPAGRDALRERDPEARSAGARTVARWTRRWPPILQKSLLVIDQAIGESRAALKAQPANDTGAGEPLRGVPLEDRRCCRTPSRSSTRCARATRPKRRGLPMA